MIEDVVKWVVDVVGKLGYPGIVIMMALESSFFPFPSEVVMIPAGYLAYKGEMNIVMVVVMGILGSLLGAFLNYYLAVRLGRPFLQRFGRYVLISEKKLDKAEVFFRKHGSITTFVGRLIPAVRQVISFPAGLARMNVLKFTIYTGVGAGLWVTVLAVFGYMAGVYEEDCLALWKAYKMEITLGLIGFIIIVIGLYVLVKYFQSKKTEPAPVE